MSNTTPLLTTIGLPQIIAALIIIALTAYVLTGGADFGGGLWDLLASGARRDAQRAHIAESLAPIWEANHVWLIVVVVMLFTAFPIAFSTLAIVLHIPLTLMLIGIVLRGSAFVFRSYAATDAAGRRRWGAAFAFASVLTPVFLGMIVGAIASDQVGSASRLLPSDESFVSVFVGAWVGWFPLATGALTLSVFAFLAAVYLAYNATEPDLQEDFRLRALASAAAVFVVAAVALVASHRAAPRIAAGVTTGAFAIPLHVLTGAAAIAAIYALWRRNYRVARIAAGAQVTGILWGWALAQYPYVIPDVLTIDAAAALRATLVLLLIGLAAGAAILLPALRYLFKIFAREPA